MRISAVSLLLAPCNGVSRISSLAFTSAPLSISSLTNSRWLPLKSSLTAQCNEVNPGSLFAFTFTPLSRYCFTAAIFPLSTAPNISRSAPEEPHPTKNTVAIAVVRKFFIAGKLSSLRVSLSSGFNHAQEAEHHRAFPKTPRAWMHYDMGQVQCQNIPVPTQNGFLDERPCVHLTERGKNRA